MVINPDPMTSVKEFGRIRSHLYDRQIRCHLAGVDTRADTFRRSKPSVTLTGVHRAKGNEAGMIYVVNAERGLANKVNLTSIRNRLFVAITRSTAWVRVLGVGSAMEALEAEFTELKRLNFTLKFRFPTRDQRKTLRIVHRDRSREQQKQLKKSDDSLKGVVHDLKAGRLILEDLDPDVLAELRQLLRANV